VQQLLYSVQQTREDAALAGFYGSNGYYSQAGGWENNYYSENGPAWYQNTSAVSPEHYPDPGNEAFVPDQVYYDGSGNPYTYDEQGNYHYQTPLKAQPYVQTWLGGQDPCFRDVIHFSRRFLNLFQW
jgi:hypothetical protein